MTGQCALCADAEATTRIGAPHPLANFVASRLGAKSISAEDVVIPLCADCRRMIRESLDRYDLDRPGGETAARADLQDFAGALDFDTVDAASE